MITAKMIRVYTACFLEVSSPFFDAFERAVCVKAKLRLVRLQFFWLVDPAVLVFAQRCVCNF